MNNNIFSALILCIGIAVTGCHGPISPDLEHASSLSLIQSTNQSSEFYSNGKRKSAEKQEELFVQQAISAAHFPIIDEKAAAAIQNQITLLKKKKRKKSQQVGNLNISERQLRETAEILLATKDNTALSHQLDAFKIKGRDNRGHVHYTGYYTPILEVSRKKTKRFQYPIYAYPQDWQGKLPTRKEIDGDKVLFGENLELAYAENLMDIYIMQVQGSGIVQYQDGTQELFSYTGSNRKKYRSIGRYMVNKGMTTVEHMSLQYIKKYIKAHPEQAEEILFSNPSYVFFKPQRQNPKGAGLVPLTEMHSIAVDTRYIPLGSILLAKVPVVNKTNEVIRHDFRLLVAQDVGAAINGPGHIDLYTGIGYPSRKAAGKLHHYGELWLLLPNQSKAAPLAMN